ncbi:MAG: YqhG family protein [Sporolactobacillus sp.]|jgi:hypothetical protein|nr:YqhG family protein [Sporolactobacillus sp.]
MQQVNIHEYLTRFFQTTGCALLPPDDDGQLKVKLTEKMDRMLMNRPFYWHYVQQTGAAAETATLVLRSESGGDGEIVHHGSPRLQRIFAAAGELGRFTRLYQRPASSASPALEPWLGLNLKISDRCDLKRDHLVSIGLQLINGTIVEGFHQLLRRLDLSPRLTDYCYTLTPLVTVASGIRRIEAHLINELKNKPADWANRAGERWLNDRLLLEAFYEQSDPKPEAYWKEREALKEQYQPRTIIRPVNVGLFYLQSASFLPTGPFRDRLPSERSAARRM